MTTICFSADYRDKLVESTQCFFGAKHCESNARYTNVFSFSNRNLLNSAWPTILKPIRRALLSCTSSMYFCFLVPSIPWGYLQNLVGKTDRSIDGDHAIPADCAIHIVAACASKTGLPNIVKQAFCKLLKSSLSQATSTVTRPRRQTRFKKGRATTVEVTSRQQQKILSLTEVRELVLCLIIRNIYYYGKV